MNPTVREQSDRLELEVARTRRRLRRNAVLAGFALVVVAAVGWLTLAAGFDMLVPMPVALRVVAWAVLWLLALGGVAAVMVWPAVRPMRLETVAFRMERALGGMYNRLVSVLDLRRGTAKTTERSGPFVERLIEQTAQRMADYRLDQVAQPKPVLRAVLVAALAVVVAMAMGLALDARMSAAVRRVLMPTRPIPPVTSVRLQVHPGDTSVLHGQPLRLWATVEGGRVDGLTLRMRPDDGDWINYPMRRQDDGTFDFTLSAVNNSYEYHVLGGGTWTESRRITMVRRPIVERLAAEVHLPAYMGLPEPRPVDEHADQISAPVGSAIRLEATVTGDVADGTVHLFEAAVQETDQTESRETIWFDDEVPPDAERSGTWRWVNDPVYGGSRAHTFGWDRRPYGFTTRLSRLAVAPGESLFFYVRIDPKDPPGRLTVRVTAGGTTHPLAWDSPGAPLADAEKKGLRYIGHLPEAGAWQRLEVPIEKVLGAKPPGPVDLDGMAFEIDRGVVTFDRAGSVRYVTQSRPQTQLKRVADLPMTRDAASGLWVARVPVEADRHLTVEFRNSLGHPSAAMKAIPVVATKDQPPTVLVERPGKSLTVPDPQPVPLMVRVFDDYGVADVSIQVAPRADAFEEGRVLATYDKPETNRLVMAALDTRALKLGPGQSVYYRLLARDRKGQQVASEPYRLGLAEPKGDNADGPVAAGLATSGLLDGIGEMIDALDGLGVTARRVLGDGLKGIEVRRDEAGAAVLLTPFGAPLTSEQIRKVLDRWNEAMTDRQRDRLLELHRQTQEQRQKVLALSLGFEKAAGEADQSFYQLPVEAEALRAMAERARQLADMLPPPFEGGRVDEDVLARLAALQKLTADQQNELADLQRQFEQLLAARETLADSPTAAHEQYAALMAQLRGQQMMHQMGGLRDFLQTQQQQLREMRLQVAGLRQEAESAGPDALDTLSAKQQELDPEALELVRRAQQLLRDRLARMQQDRDILPPPPWIPPGRREQAQPLEADTPEEDTPGESQGPDLDAIRRHLEDLEAVGDQPWWDRPVDVPLTPFTLEANDRFDGRSRPTDRPDPRLARGGYTPRQMLMQHQDQLVQALTANSNRMAGTQDQLSQVMSQLDQAMSQLGGPMQQISGMPMSAEAMQQLQQTLGSRAMQQMTAMLSSAAMQAAMMRAGSQSPLMWSSLPADPQGRTRLARPGMVLNVDLGDVDGAADQGATFYRLPPKLRQPLVEGMQERGPEAYQPLIDAYYRQLSEDVEASGAPAAKPPAAPAPAPKPPTPKPPPAPAPKTEPPKPPAPPPAPPPAADAGGGKAAP
ncbi:MAG TPA: hypothetical protein VM431_14410 [Phycisphaerae bacterium]|nr:hypothetical protein [Phycisphaerae bacterium]